MEGAGKGTSIKQQSTEAVPGQDTHRLYLLMTYVDDTIVMRAM